MKTTIELAREAGWGNVVGMPHIKALELFAELIRADERAKLLGARVEPVGWRDPSNSEPGQGCTYDKDDHTRWSHVYSQALYTAEALAARVAQAQAEEREKVIAETIYMGYVSGNYVDNYRKDIRTRGGKEQTP